MTKSKFIIKILVIFLIVLNISGCATVKRKFVRKSKDKEKETPIFYTEDFKQESPTLNTYQRCYGLWKAEEESFIEELKEAQKGAANKKALVNFAQNAHNNLIKMKDSLNETKQKELEPSIAKLEGIVNKVNKRGWNQSSATSIKAEVVSHKKFVETNFSYKKVKDSVK